MKPAFALSFSSTGISLHHHSDGDWFCVGEVSLDAPDLNTQIVALRDKGFALENDLNCKLVIPADQVRFLSVTTDGLGPKESAEKAQAELADSTPYELNELAFDTATDGPITHVAAVAKQTLEEARTFATEHGFVPVQYSTPVEGQDFPSEPTFYIGDDNPTVAEPDEVEEPSAKEPGPAVHAIAESEAPTEFRSAPVAKPSVSAPASQSVTRYAIPAAAACVIVGIAVAMWSLTGSGDEKLSAADTVQVEDTEPAPEPLTSDTQIAQAPEPEVADEPEIAVITPPEAQQPAPDGEAALDLVEETAPDLSATDAAILEALNVAPTTVEQVEQDTETQQSATPTGIEITAPGPLQDPILAPPEDLYLATLDKTDLSQDAVALPPVSSFETDLPFEQSVLPALAGAQFDLDERGLVTASAEGTLNPDGVVVYLGRPAKVPPAVPVRFEQEPIEEDPADRLAQYRPKPRPGNLLESFERQQLGGRTREELAVVRPKLRPASVQEEIEVDHTPTALAVVRVPRPKTRPAGLAPPTSTKTANLGSTAAIDQSSNEPGSFQPKSVAPKIPSTASVARQATIDNAINLRKLNLIGVYGTPANRRALVRLPSGRYKKLKVGDRLDGGSVIAIGDSELRYQKRGKNVTLKMPRS
ncbi:hypothetical protein [Ruegeria sp. Ofav3-42]|uniref:hypothetical protein n=1 Tax=Ruegeria sp. Ofav3-42 TaxID=2917759 RepID=UPI001EF4852F|nr:hypothetical protein [Ruegeria sp. Ofav3-42]MCG7519614.1 hypothetical protein [Ruegeria sp. Ofav3-42]